MKKKLSIFSEKLEDKFFRKDVNYDNIKSHKKASLRPLSEKMQF